MVSPSVPASPDAIARAAQLLRDGKLVAFPTETVYGLGADAASEAAVANIFAAKGRPRFNPLIVHVLGLAEAAALAVVEQRARLAIERFWPGPLSLVLPRRAGKGVSLLACAGLDTVALRAPAHPVAQALLNSLWPAKILDGPAAPNNYYATTPETGYSHNGLVKVDHSINRNNRLSALAWAPEDGVPILQAGAKLKVSRRDMRNQRPKIH
jgi:hypothetical protein